jgi:hypothetical protein
MATPFVIYAALESQVEWGVSILVLLANSGITLALLLPLLLLSFFQPFYRARLLAWLKVPEAS